MNVRFSLRVSLIAFIALCNACAFGKAVARTAIDTFVATCIAEHPEIQDEGMMRDVCKYAPDVAPIVKDLLSARQRGYDRTGMKPPATGMTSDAGASDASMDAH